MADKLIDVLAGIGAFLELVWFLATMLVYFTKEESRKEANENPIYLTVGFIALALCIAFLIVELSGVEDSFLGRLVCWINGPIGLIIIVILFVHNIVEIVSVLVSVLILIVIIIILVVVRCFSGGEPELVCYRKK